MPTIEDVHTSKSASSLRRELLDNKDDKEYRHAYADESLNLLVATQIKVLREEREWTQERLADEAEMQQPMISRYENINYSSWSVKTLKKLAVALDLYLDIRFRSFGDLVRTTEAFCRESLEVPSFARDPFFQECASAQDKPIPAPPKQLDNVIPIDQMKAVLAGKAQSMPQPMPPHKESGESSHAAFSGHPR